MPAGPRVRFICILGCRRPVSSGEKNTVLNMKFNDFTFILLQIFMEEDYVRKRRWVNRGDECQ